MVQKRWVISCTQKTDTAMGVYYYFYNETTKSPSKASSNFVAKFDGISEDYQIEYFKEQIIENDWADNDVLIASPDDGSTPIKYTNGRIMELTYTWL